MIARIWLEEPSWDLLAERLHRFGELRGAPCRKPSPVTRYSRIDCSSRIRHIVFSRLMLDEAVDASDQ